MNAHGSSNWLSGTSHLVKWICLRKFQTFNTGNVGISSRVRYRCRCICICFTHRDIGHEPQTNRYGRRVFHGIFLSKISRLTPCAALPPIAYSIVAFTIGYQVANFMKPKFATPAGGPHLRRASSSKPPKDDINLDLTDASPGTPAKSHGKGKGKGKGKQSTSATQNTSTEASGSSGSGSDSDSDSEVDTDSEAEDLALALSSNPQSLKPTAFDEVKLVLVVNESLKMTKGKIAAQAGHATLGCALMMKDVNPRMYKHWERHGLVIELNSEMGLCGSVEVLIIVDNQKSL